MQHTLSTDPLPVRSPLDGIVETKQHAAVILSPVNGLSHRRILYLDSYGGESMWRKIKAGDLPPHHLRGCLELVRMGYEVALAEPLPDFYFHRNPFPHDMRLLRIIRHWLGNDGIVYCGHNVLYWIPFFRFIGAVRCHVVSNLWAREPLNWSRAHTGVLALTPAAAEHARKVAPRAKVAHVGWGADISIFPTLPYCPESFFSCGISLRDHRTLSLAAARCDHPITVICPGLPNELQWPKNVTLIDGGRGWNFEEKKVSYGDLLHHHYARSAGSLIIIQNDPTQYCATGFTELVEVMAMARPVVLTRTGAMATEIDVEKEGWGVHVPPQDPGALAEAISFLANDPARAREMGARGRRLAETHYNIQRYAEDVHSFFQSL
jgi:hypothetical protein